MFAHFAKDQLKALSNRGNFKIDLYFLKVTLWIQYEITEIAPTKVFNVFSYDQVVISR
jgi:hypothetical protein